MADTQAEQLNVAGGRFVLGLGLALVNMALSSVGMTLQRYAKLLSEREKGSEDMHSLYQSDNEVGSPTSATVLLSLPACSVDIHAHDLIWAAGVLLYILAAVPDVFAYMLVPQVVCTTVACFRLVVVTCLGHFVLQEHVKRLQCIGISICTVGTVLSVVFGPRSEEGAAASEGSEFAHPEVYTYLVIGLAVLLMLLIVEHSSFSGLCHGVALPLATGLAYALEKVFNTELGFVEKPEGLQGLIDRPCYAVMWLAMALLGVMDFYLNVRGPRRLPMQVFLPIAFAVGSSLQFFQSVAIFREFKNMGTADATLSIFGAIVSLLGAMAIGEPGSSDVAPDGAALLDEQDFADNEEPTNHSRLGRTPEASEDDEPL